MNVNAELVPELQSCLEDRDRAPALRHPLVECYPYERSMNDTLNRMLLAKRRLIDEAMAEGDWEKTLLLHEKPYRVDAFMRLEKHLTDPEYWRLLGRLWVQVENMHQYWKKIPLLLSPPHRETTHRKFLMDLDELETLSTLAETVTIYRGCGPANEKGWSWTLDEEQAVWFAERFGCEAGSPFGGLVVAGECQATSVIAFFDRRGEDEILVNPADVSVTDQWTLSETGQAGQMGRE